MKKFLYQHSLAITILWIGIFGLLGGFYNTMDFPKDSNGIVYLWMLAGSILYCLKACNKNTRMITTVFMIALAIVSILFLFDILTLIEAIKEVIAYDYYLSFTTLFDNYHTSTITIFILYMSVGFVVTKVLVYYLLYQKHQKLILVSSIIWLFFPYFINHKIEYVYVYASILFILSSYIYTSSLQSLHGKGNKIGIIVLVALIGFLTAFDQIVGNDSNMQKNVVAIFDGLSYLKENGGGSQQTGSSLKPETSLPTGNIEINIDEALQVTATSPFTGYLRGYSLSTYNDNGWDTPKRGYSYPSINYYAKAISNSSSLQVQVTSLKGHTYQFVPYYTNVATTMTLDSFIESNDIKYTMYQGTPDIKVRIEDEYLDYINDNYLEVNKETTELLTTYLQQKEGNIEELKKLSVGQKTTYVSTLLKNNTRYSLTPGGLPLGKDFIDYFLNDRKEGSCTHYATSATLLLRLLDVPTRYTSGFVIDKGDFKDNVATIRNNRSHAWVEVFDQDYGWYPVEMTPTSIQEATEEKETPTTITTLLDRQSEVRQETPTDQTPTTNTPTTNPSKQATISPWIYTVGICMMLVVALVILVIGQYKIRYQSKVKKYQMLSSNEKICVGYAYLQECCINDKGNEALYLKARFSQHDITVEELETFETDVKQQVQLFYQTLPIYKKGIFRYFKAKG